MSQTANRKLEKVGAEELFIVGCLGTGFLYKTTVPAKGLFCVASPSTHPDLIIPKIRR